MSLVKEGKGMDARRGLYMASIQIEKVEYLSFVFAMEMNINCLLMKVLQNRGDYTIICKIDLCCDVDEP